MCVCDALKGTLRAGRGPEEAGDCGEAPPSGSHRGEAHCFGEREMWYHGAIKMLLLLSGLFQTGRLGLIQVRDRVVGVVCAWTPSSYSGVACDVAFWGGWVA